MSFVFTNDKINTVLNKFKTYVTSKYGPNAMQMFENKTLSGTQNNQNQYINLTENANQVASIEIRYEKCYKARSTSDSFIVSNIMSNPFSHVNMAILLAVYINIVRSVKANGDLAIVNITELMQNQTVMGLLSFFDFSEKRAYAKKMDPNGNEIYTEPTYFCEPKKGNRYLGLFLKDHSIDTIFEKAYKYSNDPSLRQQKIQQIRQQTSDNEEDVDDGVYHRINQAVIPMRTNAPTPGEKQKRPIYPRAPPPISSAAAQAEEEEDWGNLADKEDINNIDFDNGFDVDINSEDIEDVHEAVDNVNQRKEKASALTPSSMEKSGDQSLLFSDIGSINSFGSAPNTDFQLDEFNLEVEDQRVNDARTSLKRKHRSEQERFIRENEDEWSKLEEMASEITGESNLSFDRVVETMDTFFLNKGGTKKGKKSEKDKKTKKGKASKKTKKSKPKKYYMVTKRNPTVKKYFNAEDVERKIRETFQRLIQTGKIPKKSQKREQPMIIAPEVQVQADRDLIQQRDYDLRNADDLMLDAAAKQEQIDEMMMMRLKQVLEAAKQLLHNQQAEMMSLNQEAGYKRRRGTHKRRRGQRRRKSKKRMYRR